MAKSVVSKEDFTKRYINGEFGNRSPTWKSVQEWYNSRVWNNHFHFDENLYHLRNRAKGGKTFYNLRCQTLRDWYLLDEGSWTREPNWYVSMMAPTKDTIIQGEVQRTTEGLYLWKSQEPLPMREALKKNSQHLTGLTARSFLETYMNGKSYEWLQYLLDEYLDHVVEFSTYEYCWGTDPGFNTVFWEVRKY